MHFTCSAARKIKKKEKKPLKKKNHNGFKKGREKNLFKED